MSMVKVTTIGAEKLDRVNKLLAGFPAGAVKASASALKRAGSSAKTKAGQFAAAEYTIRKGDFMRNVTTKTHMHSNAGSVVSLQISFAGNVLPLLTFHTQYSKDGMLQTQVKRNGGAATLEHAFAERVFGPVAVFERVGSSRFPVEQKFGPSTAHMMQNEAVIEKMDKTIQETFDKRIEHEILRIMNGWGGKA